MKTLCMFLAIVMLIGCLTGCASSETAQAENVTTCTEEPTIDTQAFNKDPVLEHPHTEVPFEVQYIRTDGYTDGAVYPEVAFILRPEELQSYYTGNKDRFDLEHRENYGSDYTIGFLDACEKYDEAYFKENYLILVALEEPSGSVRHAVEQVIVDFGGQDTELWIKRIVPEAGTDDMAQWHLIVELQKHGVTEYSGAVQVYIDGELAYDVDRIVPPEEAPSFTEPPAGTVVTPWQESSMMPGGYHWFYKLSDGTESGTIADQGSRPVSRGCVHPILIGKDQVETVYLPVPGSDVYEPTNSLGYPVKIFWEVPPKSVQCTAWPEAVWEQEGIEETHVAWNPGDIFYAKEGGWLYEFFASWEGEDYHGTANYYVYIVGGADHTHQPATEPQTVDDPVTGYCGNTWTTLHLPNGQDYSFMYGHSVTLTDILANLNYDPMKVCRCLPQYTVDTEFGTGYGINLAEGYARCDKGQTDLTKEQVETIREIIQWAIETNCTYPIEN